MSLSLLPNINHIQSAHFIHATTSSLAKLFLINKAFCVGTQISNPTFWYKIKTQIMIFWLTDGDIQASRSQVVSTVYLSWNEKLAGEEEVKQTAVKIAKEKAPCLASFTKIIGILSWMNKLRFLMDFIWMRLHEGEQTYVHYTNSQDILLSRVLGFLVC